MFTNHKINKVDEKLSASLLLTCKKFHVEALRRQWGTKLVQHQKATFKSGLATCNQHICKRILVWLLKKLSRAQATLEGYFSALATCNQHICKMIIVRLLNFRLKKLSRGQATLECYFSSLATWNQPEGASFNPGYLPKTNARTNLS